MGRPATEIEIDLAKSICGQQDEIHNLKERTNKLENLVKEWREKADAELNINAELHTETAHQAERIKELEDKIDIAITAVQTAKCHACPLCKDYLNEAEQALA